jgi:hypothetical protein
MFGNRHEQDLADIKNATKELSERLQTVVERLDKLIEAQTAAPGPDPAVAAEAVGSATAEPAGSKQRKRRAKAERRAEAAQQADAAPVAAAESDEPAEPRRKREDGRTKREIRGSRQPVAVGAETAANESAGEGDQEQAGDDASSSGPEEE